MRAAAGAAAVLLAAACTNGGHPAARPTAPVTSSPATPVPHRPPTGPPAPPDDPSCTAVYGMRNVTGRPMAFSGARTGVVAYGSLVYRTTDGAATWRAAQDLQGDTSDLVPAGCGTLYAVMTDLRLYRSVDAGATWRRIAAHVNVARLDFVTPRTGFGVGWQGETSLRSTSDGGVTWQRLPAFGGKVRTVSAATPRLLLAATERGLLRSDDGGVTAKTVLPESVLSVAFAPGGRHAWALASTTDERYRETYYVWHSGDSGLHWQVVASGHQPNESGPEPTDTTFGVRGQLAAYGTAALLPAYGSIRAGVTLATAGSRHLVRFRPRYEPYRPHSIESMQWVDARHAYASDALIGGHLYATSDGGRSWHEVPLP